jgi:hypothetical protein
LVAADGVSLSAAGASSDLSARLLCGLRSLAGASLRERSEDDETLSERRGAGPGPSFAVPAACVLLSTSAPN